VGGTGRAETGCKIDFVISIGRNEICKYTYEQQQYKYNPARCTKRFFFDQPYYDICKQTAFLVFFASVNAAELLVFIVFNLNH
jgi:hypothetical protein